MPPPSTPSLPAGFRASAVSCGIAGERLDLGLVALDEPASAAAVYTTNRLLGAHVHLCREHLERSGGRVRALVVNAGNANCCTGEEGLADARAVAAAVAERLGTAPEEVLFLSTGVIGARLPTGRILEALPELTGALSDAGLDDFSRAILTTDTRPKLAQAEAGAARVVGVAKGSGMIHPDMATMLGFLLTDADLGRAPHALLSGVSKRSFERVTVDGDTSPNDTVVLLGSGQREASSKELEAALTSVSVELARAIAADGEGATRLVTVRVEGAPDEAAAVRVGRVIATSPLTKTAVNGLDPNWGRILAAAGRSGVEFDPDRARVWIGPGTVYSEGRPHPEEENASHRHMVDESEVLLGIDLAAGDARADVWTCDLSSDYVRINADYRT